MSAEMLGRSCETRPKGCHVGRFPFIVVAREFRLSYWRFEKASTSALGRNS